MQSHQVYSLKIIYEILKYTKKRIGIAETTHTPF